MKKVFISQSNYIPWRGYFDAISSVDEFIIYDDVQYTKRDWRNRNKIKTPKGDIWLSIPIEVKNKFHQKIREAKISESNWAQNHWKTLQTNYSKTPYFKTYAPLFEEVYLEKKYTYLTEVNYNFLKLICSLLEIRTKITFTLDFPLSTGDRSEKLLDICSRVGASDYFSGPAAMNYLNEELFEKEKIKVHYFDYSGYDPYPQPYGPFSNGLSVIDLLFNVGPESSRLFSTSNKTTRTLSPELVLG